MSVLEFLGPIEPWPAAKTADAVQAHKSRMILQANALHAAKATDSWAGVLAHACDRGAATWEHWLLTHAGEDYEERKSCAHSAVTLAQRSGDWALVGEVLATWERLGRGHERFYRDARRAHDARRAAFDEALRRRGPLGAAIVERDDPSAATRLLHETGHYASVGDSGYTLMIRAMAHTALGAHQDALREGFACCIAMPLEALVTERWLFRLADSDEPLAASDRARARAVLWFDDQPDVWAIALNLANQRGAEFGDAAPSNALIESALAAAHRPGVPTLTAAFAIYSAARALALRGEHERAFRVVDEVIERLAGSLPLVVLHASLAQQLGRADALGRLLSLVRSSNARRYRAHEWDLAARLLTRVHAYPDAVLAFERAGVSSDGSTGDAFGAPTLNDYGVALVGVGRFDDARAALQRGLALAPDDLQVRRNVQALAAAPPRELLPANDDMLAALSAGLRPPETEFLRAANS